MTTVDQKAMVQLAEEGDLQAQVDLAKLRISQERYEDAATWLRRAADRQNSEAQCLLGSLLSEGLGVDQDYEAAAFYLRLAAEQGHSGAQIMLAQNFESGTGVPSNHAIAAQWYKRAAEQGDALAQYRYGELMLRGDGVEQDSAGAIEWLRKAANSGLLDAQVELVESLATTAGGKEEAIHWAKVAAERGSAKAQYLLAMEVETEPTGEVAIRNAESLYRLAAEQGFRDAQLRLAALYAEGKIVPKDPSEAEKWLDMAIAADLEAMPDAPEPEQVIQAKTSLSAGHQRMSMVSTVIDYPPGSILDKKYFILSLLGKGGMCRVYKAKHMTMNRNVAIKMLLPEQAANPGLVARFEREAQAASALSHPNVVTIYDLGTAPDGKPFIVMDYLEGDSLDTRLEAIGALSVPQFISVFKQVCSALEAAHEASIIHRDIKPSNIMLCQVKNQKDVVKVVDFGLAKVLDGDAESNKLTKSGEVFGTLLYMSPEQCLGHPLDARTDIYSVGCTMYEAVADAVLFAANSPYELMSKHINEKPRPFNEVVPELKIPAEVERIIFKAVAKNRDERYQSMTELLTDLSALG